MEKGYKNTIPTLYILCGLPFSGKSLLSKEIMRTTSIQRISFDDRWNTFKNLDKGISYEETHRKVEEEITKNLEMGVSIIYDSTNLSVKNRDALKTLAKRAHAQAKIIYLKVPPEEIYKRRGQSLIDKSHINVLSDKEMQNAIDRLEVPTDCICLSTDEEKSKFLKNL